LFVVCSIEWNEVLCNGRFDLAILIMTLHWSSVGYLNCDPAHAIL